jgi:hypothetical protein
MIALLALIAPVWAEDIVVGPGIEACIPARCGAGAMKICSTGSNSPEACSFLADKGWSFSCRTRGSPWSELWCKAEPCELSACSAYGAACSATDKDRAACNALAVMGYTPACTTPETGRWTEVWCARLEAPVDPKMPVWQPWETQELSTFEMTTEAEWKAALASQKVLAKKARREAHRKKKTEKQAPTPAPPVFSEMNPDPSAPPVESLPDTAPPAPVPDLTPVP